MNTFERPHGTRREHARRIFAEIADTEDLMQAMANHRAPKRVAASALYGAATNAEDIPVDAATSRAARAFYRRAVAATAHFAIPAARAASSAQILERHGEDCRIHVERSRAEPTQFYVVVELLRGARGAGMPSWLLVCDSHDNCQRFALPQVRDGIAQIIAEGDSDLMRLIGDPTARVYLT